MISRDYFKNKRIAVIGLGHHGEMVEDIKFLIKGGALVSVYDMKSEARLKKHLVFLRSIGLANYVCGSIPADDLLDMDIIILSHEYSRDANFLHAVNNSSRPISIEYPETLFFKQAPPVTVVGIMGEFGKSSLVSMLKPLFEIISKDKDDQKLFVIDPDSNEGILTHLKKIRSGDIVLIRIISLMMKELYKIRISPHVAIFASLPCQSSYDKSVFEILSYQTYNNYIIASDEIIDMTHSLQAQPKAKMLRTRPSIIPLDWGIGEKFYLHERENMALAYQTAKLFKIDDDIIQDVLTKWSSLKGRLEFVKKIKNIEFYNDSASISPMSTKLAISVLSKNKNIILIFGGTKSHGIYGHLYEVISDYVHTVILLPGSGTFLERRSIEKIKNIKLKSAPSMEESLQIAIESANKGDIVLFSPGFDSVGIDGSRKERGDKFVKILRNI